MSASAAHELGALSTCEEAGISRVWLDQPPEAGSDNVGFGLAGSSAHLAEGTRCCCFLLLLGWVYLYAAPV